MAAPSYQGNGGIGATDNSASCAVPFPSLQANDILLLQLLSAGSGSDTHQQPSGFAEIVAQTNQSTNCDVSWWWKRAAGTESGNLTCTRSLNSDAFFGIMSCWRGAVTTGTPFNTAGPVVGRTTSFSSSAITPTYDYARVICLCNLEDNVALGTLAGGNYAENFDVDSSTGDDCSFTANSYAQTAATAEAARAGTVGGTDSWATCTLALWSVLTKALTINATRDTGAGVGNAAVVNAARVLTATDDAATAASHNPILNAAMNIAIVDPVLNASVHAHRINAQTRVGVVGKRGG